MLRKKPYFRDEVENNQLGCDKLTKVMFDLKPKKWFAAHLHVGFDAVVDHGSDRKTHFTALDKCLPNRDFLRVIRSIL